jgi:hypothetical protein
MQKTHVRGGRRLAALAGVLTLGALGAMAGPAWAQVGRFNGGGVVFGFSDACRTAGMQRATQAYTVLYQPRQMGSNGNRESLGFIAPWGALTYFIDGAAFGTAFAPVTLTGIFHGSFSIPQTDANAPRLRITARTPASVTPALRTPVRLTGEVQNWSGVRGCSVRFDLVVGQDIP